MRMWCRSALLLGLIVAVLLGATSPTMAAGQADDAPHEWVNLGPAGTSSSTALKALAVAPEWPIDHFILAFQGSGGAGAPSDTVSQVVRSRNGGESWERFEAPVQYVRALTIGPSSTEGRVIFAESGAIYRSLDDGATWEKSLEFPGDVVESMLTLAPGFAHDRTMFVSSQKALYRSVDRGDSWERLDPAGGQFIQSFALSPNFAADQTIFLASTTIDDPQPWAYGQGDLAAEGVAHEQSLGVLKSVDGGATWAPVNAGLQHEGLPYRRVQGLTVSPTFGEDHTIFAFALGPYEDTTAGAMPARGLRAALFRSQDAGASWALAYEPAWRPTGGGMTAIPYYQIHAELSPRFAADGTGLLAESVALAGARGRGCAVLRTDDFGATWHRAILPVDLTGGGSWGVGCSDLRFLPGDGDHPVAFAQIRRSDGPSSVQPVRSPDGGVTWERFSPVGQRFDTATSSAVAGDGTIFLGAQNGVWAFGPSAGAR